MNPTEIAIYAVETKAIIQILWGLLLITPITLVSVSIMYVLLRLQLRSNRRREQQLARHIANKATEIGQLQERLAKYAELEAGAEELKGEMRRIVGIRARTEERMVEQNAAMDTLRQQVGTQTEELERLRKLVQHVDDL